MKDKAFVDMNLPYFGRGLSWCIGLFRIGLGDGLRGLGGAYSFSGSTKCFSKGFKNGYL